MDILLLKAMPQILKSGFTDNMADKIIMMDWDDPWDVHI
jgi:hypothetical protein